MGHKLSTVTWAPDKYIFVSDDPVPSLWYSLLGQSVFSSRMRCRSILLRYTCVDSRDFSRKTASTRCNCQNVYFNESERC